MLIKKNIKLIKDEYHKEFIGSSSDFSFGFINVSFSTLEKKEMQLNYQMMRPLKRLKRLL